MRIVKKCFFVIVFIFAIVVGIVKADKEDKVPRAEVVANIEMAICENGTGMLIPTGGTSPGGEYYWPYFDYKYQEIFSNTGIYYCVSESTDGGMIGSGAPKYYVVHPNPTQMIYFPITYWAYVKDSEYANELKRLGKHPYTAFWNFWKDYNGTIAASEALDYIKTYCDEDDSECIAEGKRYGLFAGVYNDDKEQYGLEMLDALEKANPSYAQSECEKYCNACYSNGFSYYCYDYDMKPEYYTNTSVNFEGEGKAWSNFGWELLDGLGHLLPWNWGKDWEVWETKMIFDNTVDACIDQYRNTDGYNTCGAYHHRLRREVH